MKNEYIENFDGITAGEEIKQQTINKLIQFANANIESEAKAVKENKHFTWNIKKITVATLTVTVLVFLTIFIPIMASQNGGQNINEGFEWGFDNNSSEPSNPYYAAYRTDKSEFDINDVKITFFLGSSHDSNPYDGCNIVHKLYICNDGNSDKFKEIFVKDIEDYFDRQDKLRNTSGKTPTEYRFPFSEVIVIPPEIFTEQSGTVLIYMREYISWENTIFENVYEPEYGNVNGIGVYYKISGEKVTLSSKAFAK
jgi:hypothetical protein